MKNIEKIASEIMKTAIAAQKLRNMIFEMEELDDTVKETAQELRESLEKTEEMIDKEISRHQKKINEYNNGKVVIKQIENNIIPNNRIRMKPISELKKLFPKVKEKDADAIKRAQDLLSKFNDVEYVKRNENDILRKLTGGWFDYGG